MSLTTVTRLDLVLLLALFGLVSFSLFLPRGVATDSNKIVLSWACLNVCGENNSQQIQQIHDHSPLAGSGDLTAVSFEAFGLGKNSTVVWENNQNITQDLRNWGLQSYPMLGSIKIHEIRQLFRNPFPVIQACIELGKKNRWTGWNIDFEPVYGVTVQDGVDFAAFLNTFAVALHVYEMTLSVDVASWNTNFWNFSLIAATAIDYVITMDTYEAGWKQWLHDFDHALETIPIKKLGIGLESTKPSGQPWTEEDLFRRFQSITASQVIQIDIWDLPINNSMWSFISNWTNTNLSNYY